MRFSQSLGWALALGSLLSSCKNSSILPADQQNPDNDTTTIVIPQNPDSQKPHKDTLFLPVRVFIANENPHMDGYHTWYEPLEEDSRRTRLQQDEWLRLVKMDDEGAYQCKLHVTSNMVPDDHGNPNRVIYKNNYDDFKNNKVMDGVLFIIEPAEADQKITISTSPDTRADYDVVALQCTEKFDITMAEDKRRGFKANLHENNNLIPSNGVDYRIE